MNRGASNASTINRKYMENDGQASALVSAAANGHGGIVRQLIQSGANVNSGSRVMGCLGFWPGRSCRSRTLRHRQNSSGE